MVEWSKKLHLVKFKKLSKIIFEWLLHENFHFFFLTLWSYNPQNLESFHYVKIVLKQM
jgi:hypothetical protein